VPTIRNGTPVVRIVTATALSAVALAAWLPLLTARGDVTTGPYDAAIHLSRAIGSRPAASAKEAKAQAYVADEFRDAGLAVSVDRFRVPGRGTSRNVVGIYDTPADCTRIFMAHVDSSPKGPGANDNASGSGVIVALAARLAALKPACDIWLSTNGAEERFYTRSPAHLGAQALVDRVRGAGIVPRLKSVLDFDEVGRGGRFWLRSPAASPRPALEGAVLGAAKDAGVTVRWVRDSGSGNSDHREFNIAGIPAAVLESWNGAEPCRELACDRPSRLQKGSLSAALRIAERVASG
jgi:hypothetical protein